MIPEKAAGPSRSTWIKWAGTVNVAFTAADGFAQVYTGHRRPEVTGAQFVMALPPTLYGIDFIRKDPGDWVAWGLTMWSAGLVVHGFWPVVFRDKPPAEKPSLHQIRVGPTQVVGWADHKARPGLGLSGRF